MLNASSFSSLFSPSAASLNRKYKPQQNRESYCKNPKHANLVARTKSYRLQQINHNQQLFEGLLDFLNSPAEMWIENYINHFDKYCIDEWMYKEIIRHSTKKSKEHQKNSLKQGHHGFPIVNSIITAFDIPISSEGSSAVSLFLIANASQESSSSDFIFQASENGNQISADKPKVSLHNIFVLMTQYKVMEKIIYDLKVTEFEMMIDGLSCMYLKGVGKLKNIGEYISEDEILLGKGVCGTIDELSCCIHFITTHTKAYIQGAKQSNQQKLEILKGVVRNTHIFSRSLKVSHSDSQPLNMLSKQIQTKNLANLIKVYDYLQTNNRVDNMVNSIPMIMEFLEVFVQNPNNCISGCELVMNVKWLSGLGEGIIKNVHDTIKMLQFQDLEARGELGEVFTQQDIDHFKQKICKEKQRQQNLSNGNFEASNQIIQKLREKAQLLKQTSGQISPKILFSYAFRHLYSFGFLIKVTLKILRLSQSHYTVFKECCQKMVSFLTMLFESSYQFQYPIPETCIDDVISILQILNRENEYLFDGMPEKYITGVNFLYSEQLESPQLSAFIDKMKNSKLYGSYFSGKCQDQESQSEGFRNIASQQKPHQSDEVKDSELFRLEESTSKSGLISNCLLNNMLRQLYMSDTQLQYLGLILQFLRGASKRNRMRLQFYLIKNEFLHFLIESRADIFRQIKSKQNRNRFIEIYFDLIAELIKGNLVAYRVLDRVIDQLADLELGSKSRSVFLDRQKDSFTESIKQFFPNAKRLLMTCIADVINCNNRQEAQSLGFHVRKSHLYNHEQYYFMPRIVQKLLYPSFQGSYSPEQSKNNLSNSQKQHQSGFSEMFSQLQSSPMPEQVPSRHSVWISYVIDVIILELKTLKLRTEQALKKSKQRAEAISPSFQSLTRKLQDDDQKRLRDPREKQIFEWTTFILLLHVQYTLARKVEKQDEQIILGAFIMKYLEGILKESIKWKPFQYQETERVIDFMHLLEQWEIYYTTLIIATDENTDPLLIQFGGGLLNYYTLKKWSKKIGKIIRMYLESVQSVPRMPPKVTLKISKSKDKKVISDIQIPYE